MTRTDQRPLPQGELSAFHASSFAIVIGIVGALILYFYINTLTMILTLASLIGYAFIYTVSQKSNAAKYCYWWLSRSGTSAFRLVFNF